MAEGDRRARQTCLRPAEPTRSASAYAHAILAEDGFVQGGCCRGGLRSSPTAWSSRTGGGPPHAAPRRGRGARLEDWYPSVVVDVAACRAYAQGGLRGERGAFLEEADDEGDEPLHGTCRQRASGALPAGKRLFGVFVIWAHEQPSRGEVSAVLRGSTGSRGYPLLALPMSRGGMGP